MRRERQHARRLFAAALSCVLTASAAATASQQDGPNGVVPDTQAPPPIADRLRGLTDALFGEDELDAADARQQLLLADLDHDALVALAAAAENETQLAVAEDIAKHHVLTRLRHEELADLEDDTVLIGFQFQPTATAGQVGPDTADLVEQFPYGALVSSTTAGFPGYAYLRPGDMIVRIDGEPIPEARLAAQQHVIDAVRDHALGEPVAMSVIRDGGLIELAVPLARAAALPKMYDARTITRDLIDPFLFLWEEQWSTILFDAGYEEQAD